MTTLESSLRRLAGALPVEALEALGNRGLLRRALKDLERGERPRILRESDATIYFAAGDFEVALPASGPAQATCSCPAPGVCQHILAVMLFLQQAGGESTPAPAPAEATGPLPESSVADLSAILTFEAAELEAWAGRAAFRAGLNLAAQNESIVTGGTMISVTFPGLRAGIRWVAGSGLDGMITTGEVRDASALIVAAVVAAQQKAGRTWELPVAAREAPRDHGTPRSETEVLAACRALAAGNLVTGLVRLSPAVQQRWATLAMSALGVQLPRLALALRGIADEVALILARDARSDAERLLQRLARMEALACALQARGDRPRPDLVGTGRSQYIEVGRLELLGVAAWPWRTASGYEGLTVLFWDPAARGWSSWSEARPRHPATGFNPVLRHGAAGPWEGANSPRQVSRSSIRLMRARLNRARRLSASASCRALVTGPTPPLESFAPVITDWAALDQRWNAAVAVGLKEPDPLDFIVVVKPAGWGDRGFDPVRQVFAWNLLDGHGFPLSLELAFDDLSQPAIQRLESLPMSTVAGALLVGRLERRPSGLALLPFTVHPAAGGIIQLFLDPPSGSVPVPAVASPPADAGPERESKHDPTEEPGEVSGDEPDPPGDLMATGGISPFVDRGISEVGDLLLSLAESGLGLPQSERLRRLDDLAAMLGRLGFGLLDGALVTLVREPGAVSLLRAAYLVDVHRDAASQIDPR